MNPMQTRWPTAWLVVAAVMFAVAPVLIAQAPNEATMGLVAKIFYFHVPAWFAMFLAIFICGIASGIYLFREREAADRLAVSGGGAGSALRRDGPHHRGRSGRACRGASGGSGMSG